MASVKIQKTLWNNCYHKKVLIITYSEIIFVALDLQHTKNMRCNLLSSVAYRVYTIYPRYLMKDTIFGKELFNIKYVFRFPLQILGATFLVLRRIEWDIVINLNTALWKVPIILARFN